MKHFILSSLCALCWFGYSVSQTPAQQITRQYDQYLANHHESLFLQLNKQQFLTKEVIHFSCFQSLPDRALSAAVMLHVSVYNQDHKRVTTTFHEIYNGQAIGNLNLSLDAGRYIIVATTLNKQGDVISNTAVVPIQIYKTVQEMRAAQSELLPVLTANADGGRLQADTINTISYYISNFDTQRYPISAIQLLEDSGGLILEDIQPLFGGIGSFKFQPEMGRRYSIAVFFEDGNVIRTDLPPVTATAIVFKVNSLLKDKILISYQKSEVENRFSSQGNTNTAITVAIHDLKSMQSIDFDMKEQQGAIVIPKASIAPRFNIVSVFDADKNLIYERFIYNDYGLNQSVKPEATLVSKVNDTVGLFWANLDALPIASLGVYPLTNSTDDVIPEYSKILNKFDKYIRIDDGYLSRVESRKKLALLDLLAMSLGSSAVDWKTVMDASTKNAKELYAYFSLDGNLSRAIPGSQKITMYQKELGQLYDTQMMGNGSFAIDQLRIIKDVPMYFSVHPGGSGDETIDFTISPDPNTAAGLSQQQLKLFDPWLKDSRQSLEQPEAFISVKDELALDNVVVTAEKEKETVNVSRNPNLSLAFFDADKIDTKMANRYTFLSNYIRKLGFKVAIDPQTEGLLISSRTILEPPPILYVDGFRSSGPLYDIPLDNIDEVYYEHNGVEGSSGGTIYIYRKESFEKSNALIKNSPSIGFEPLVPFQPPFQITAANPAAMVMWEPLLRVGSALESYEFLSLKQASVRCVLYGIDQDGYYQVYRQNIDLASE